MELINVTKAFQKKQEVINILDNLNYKFDLGKFYVITGPSGSGKSTLIDILGLLEPLSSGEYLINNKNSSKLNSKEINLIRNKEFGFIFQDYYLDDHLKAYENVMLPMMINNNDSIETIRNKAIKLLENVGLKNRTNHYPKELSGGEKERVAIARALSNNPKYILADEPTGNLDEENAKKVFEDLSDLKNENKCIIVVSHSKDSYKYADVILKLNNGKFEAIK